MDASNTSRVREILEIEAAAISSAAAALDEKAVNNALEILAGCKGKIILTGVGKSGVIAQKIAQTLASTGSVAIYLQPSEALHGGLGVIAPGDVMVALSNSGETEELLAIFPSARSKGCLIVSIVGNGSSSLGRLSDVVVEARVEKEACPLNLAPTASTTLALALGDALAMTLMEIKGLTESDFAVNHPAGRLGKRLTLKVSDLMHASPNILPDEGWLQVIRAISRHSLGAVNVVDENGKLIGIITDGDLRRTIERTEPQRLSSLCAANMMTRSPVHTRPDALAFDALKLMEDRPSQISVLPVADADGVCVGLLRIHDIVRSGL